MRKFVGNHWPVAGLTAVWLLWMAWVWYANYVECDDRLRDMGTRFESGHLERCTLPQQPFEIHELYWLLGTVVFGVGTVLLRRKRLPKE